EEMVINLPADWKTKKISSIFTCPGFEFEKQAASVKRQVTLKYDYRSLKDFIDPNEADDYLSKMEKTRDQLNYGLSYGDNTNDSVSKHGSRKIGLLALIISFFIAGLVLWTQRKPSA